MLAKNTIIESSENDYNYHNNSRHTISISTGAWVAVLTDDAKWPGDGGPEQ